MKLPQLVLLLLVSVLFASQRAPRALAQTGPIVRELQRQENNAYARDVLNRANDQKRAEKERARALQDAQLRAVTKPDSARRHATVQNQAAEEATEVKYQALLQQYNNCANELFPDAADAGSRLSKEFDRLSEELHEADAPVCEDPRSPLFITLMAAANLGIAPQTVKQISPSQLPSLTDAQKDEIRKDSQRRTVAVYPDSANPNSALVRRMFEIDDQLRGAVDPLYFSPDKPFQLVQRAARDLGISPRK